jgi:phenylacetate-CoA oxygenase PaaI subunit
MDGMERRAHTADQDLFDLVARLADNKYFLGRRYAEWCSGAPTLESGVSAAAMAQDELGHARALYPLLRDLAPASVEPAAVDPDTRTHFVNMAGLDAPFGGWPAFVAANFLVDTALSTVFDAAQASTYEPLAARSRKVLQEERIHTLHGQAWVRRLTGEAPAVSQALEAALRYVWDEVLCWFGPESARDPLATRGVLNAAPDALRARFLDAAAPLIVAPGLKLPVRRRGANGEGWELSAPLPWERWDAATYRLEPLPVATPSARARARKAGGL